MGLCMHAVSTLTGDKTDQATIHYSTVFNLCTCMLSPFDILVIHVNDISYEPSLDRPAPMSTAKYN